MESDVFDHIVIAIDGSDEARAAAEMGLRVAARFNARISGISVIDVRVVEGPAVETLSPLWGEVTGRPFQPEVMRLYRERADSALDDLCSAAERAGVEPVDRSIEIGVAEDVLVDRTGDADLLVMGRRGEHGGFGRRNLGATLWRVLHRASCPVLVAGHPSPSEMTPAVEHPILPSRTLVAWEPTHRGISALELAVGYCQIVGAELRVVCAGDESHDSAMDEALERLADAGLSWESCRLDVQPADAVEEAIRRWNADCLFMGAFGRGVLRDRLFGSHTGDILQRITIPVFVCR